MTKIDFSRHRIRYSQVSDFDLLDDGFESGVEEFTTYYHINMLGDVRERIVQAYRMVLDGTVVGYVTVSLAHLKPDATRAIKAKEITSNIPALLISHLAVHKDYLRRGIGSKLLDMVFSGVVPDIESKAGCRYVMLHPRDDPEVHMFYKKCRFEYEPRSDRNPDHDLFLFDLKNKHISQI